MAFDLTVLATELQDARYQPFIPDSPGIIVSMLNAGYQGIKIVNREIGIGTIMDALGPDQGAALLDTLEAHKTTVPTIKWAFYLLEKGDLDIGLASTRSAIDSLVAAGIIQSSDATVIKDLANAPASKSEILFGNNYYVTEEQVRAAIELNQAIGG